MTQANGEGNGETLEQAGDRAPAESAAVAERVLIVEDDAATRSGLTELVRSWGFNAEGAADGDEGYRKVTSFRPAIIVADLVMPRMSGLDLLRALQDQLGDITVVILTAQGSVESAVEAMKQGVYDYLTKPVDPQRLKILLDKIVERQETLREVKVLRRQLRDQGRYGPMIGSSPGIRKVYRVVEQAAPTMASVLISGESGTGKELVAQTIHQLSPRASFPFVAINCAAIPETLLESEIFGHEKGAFTGAVDRRLGCFELAHRGTIFLDEIAEMQPATQVKLLRVLQERTFRRLGGRQEQAVDVRVIAATNKALEQEIGESRFREDLYYRLNVVPIHVPPLRSRREDIPLLVQRFVGDSGRNGLKPKPFEDDALKALSQRDWPGNVRELRNTVERLLILSSGDRVTVADVERLSQAVSEVALADLIHCDTFESFKQAAERAFLQAKLEANDWNVSETARSLSMPRSNLYKKIEKYGLARK